MFGLLNERNTGFFQLTGQAVFLLLLTSLFLFGFMMHTTIFASDDGLMTTYHVYVDGEYIGEVDDRSVVEEVTKSKTQSTDDTVERVVVENITYVSEKTFEPTYNNNQVEKELEDVLTIKAKAYELKIDDKVLGYFPDKAKTKEVVEEYQKQYVDEEEFEDLQSRDNSIHKDFIDIEDKDLQKDTPSLSVGDSQLIDVSLADDVNLSVKQVETNKVIDVEEGITLLEKGTLEDKKHTVVEGDLLDDIAEKYDLTIKELLKLNPSIDEDTLLQIDDELHVTALKPFSDVIVLEEELVEEDIKYETEVIESEEMYKGEEKVKQKGKDGKKKVHYKIEKTNGKETEREIVEEETIKKPTKKKIVKGTKVIPSRGSGELTWPTNGGYISSDYGHRWGRMHKGIDIARPSNRTIKAADHGVVSSAGNEASYGNKVVIDHNNGMKTIYAHLSSIDVSVGEKIEKGSKIGVMGSTGNSTGIHLHFEVHENGEIQNPQSFY